MASAMRLKFRCRDRIDEKERREKKGGTGFYVFTYPSGNGILLTRFEDRRKKGEKNKKKKKKKKTTWKSHKHPCSCASVS